MSFPETLQLSPNRDATRRHEGLGVAFHHTEIPGEEALRLMSDPAFQRSYHGIVREDGCRIVLVPDDEIAWHAGVSSFHGRPRCNDFLLGLSFAGDTYRAPLTEAQIASALEWLGNRWRARQWTLDWMTDHRQIAPERKRDLNPLEWDRLFAAIAARFGV